MSKLKNFLRKIGIREDGKPGELGHLILLGILCFPIAAEIGVTLSYCLNPDMLKPKERLLVSPPKIEKVIEEPVYLRTFNSINYGELKKQGNHYELYIEIDPYNKFRLEGELEKRVK